MLLDHIERIRRKPLEVRRRYAFTVSAIFTGLIAMIWLVTLVARFDAARFGFGQQREQEPVLERPGIMDELRESFNAPEMLIPDESVRPAASIEPEGIDVVSEEEQETGDTDLVTELGNGEVEQTETSPIEEIEERSGDDVWEEGESLVPLPTQG